MGKARKGRLERFLARWSFVGTRPGDKFEADLLTLLAAAWYTGKAADEDTDCPYTQE